MNREDLLCSPETLSALCDQRSPSVLDCRFNLVAPNEGLEQYREAHIPTAIYVHLDDELSASRGPSTGRHPLPSAETAVEMFRRKGVRQDRPVIVYDDSNGAIAARAWWMLRWLGHPDARLLEGGLTAWRNAGLALESGDSDIADGDFDARAGRDWLVTTEDIQAGALGLPLVDARAANRFAGQAEPIDPVAGHVPGAINLPFDRALDGEGRFLDREQLSRLWVDITGTEDDVAVMCGSGVTACHLAISALLAGRSMPRLYAGSWSEWIRDPSRPVARD